jgi:membrane protease YdiL (CAAX protease family)
MLEGFAQPAMLVPGFLSLTLAGGMLGLAFQRTGTLYFSFGLHAGWIFWLKCYVVVTNTRAGAETSVWGTAKLYDGWLGLLVLVAANVVVWRLSSSVAAPEFGAQVRNDSLTPQLDKSGHV